LKLEIKYYNEAEGYAQIRKVVIGVILIHLDQEDFVAADHFFRDALGYVYLFFPHYCELFGLTLYLYSEKEWRYMYKVFAANLRYVAAIFLSINWHGIFYILGMFFSNIVDLVGSVVRSRFYSVCFHYIT
jgi:hypothetical protein